MFVGGTALKKWWIYLAGPLLGGCLAVLFVYLLAPYQNPGAEKKATGQGSAVEIVPITSE